MPQRRQCLAVLLPSLLLAGGECLAARPLLIDDPAPIPHGTFQLEVGGAYQKNSRVQNELFPFRLAYGLVPGLEIGIGGGGQLLQSPNAAAPDEVTTIGGPLDLGLGGKWQFLTAEQALLDQSLAASVTLPLASHREGLGTGRADADLTYIAGREITEAWSAFANLGYTYRDKRRGESISDIVHTGAATTYQLTNTLQPVAEVVVLLPSQYGQSAGGANMGLRYEIAPGWTLDAAAGTKLFGDWSDLLATAGITWLF